MDDGKIKQKTDKIQKIIDKNDDKVDNEKAKLFCKYRYSCYEENELNNLLKDEKYKKQTNILISKPSSSIDTLSEVETPLTVQEIAELAVEDLNEQEKRINGKSRISKAEKNMQNAQEKLKQKINCKYRKSCYNNGKIPKIEKSKFKIWFPTFNNYLEKSATIIKKKVDFEELEKGQMKLYCKYRSSCYKSGIKPKIEEFHYKEIIETIKEEKERPLKERCKYRVSCYKSGVLPIKLNSVDSIKKKTDTPILTTKEQLKLYCKYRKSCYIRYAENKKTEEIIENSFKTTSSIDKKNHKSDKEGLKDKETELKEVIINENTANKTALDIKSKKIRFIQIKNLIQKSKLKSPISVLQPKTPINKEIKNYNKETKEKEIKRKPQNEEIIKEKIKPKNAQKSKKESTKKKCKKKDLNNDLSELKVSEETSKEEEKLEIVKVDEEELKEKRQIHENQNKLENDKKKEVIINKIINDAERLKCKYRKSCYKTIKYKVPNLKYQIKVDPENSDTILITTSKKPIKEWEQRKREEMLKCKYRKSCYPPIEIIEDKNVPIKNLTLKDLQEDVVKKIKNNPSHHNLKENNENMPSLKELPIVLTPELKISCKYRQSCYKDPNKWSVYNIGKKQSTLEVHVPVHSLETCNKYYLSCRERLGLAPKEKAPIGPNGKKLCRKKKPPII